jgi:hypothetical protein
MLLSATGFDSERAERLVPLAQLLIYLFGKKLGNQLKKTPTDIHQRESDPGKAREEENERGCEKRVQ